jgi:hypothetical protein
MFSFSKACICLLALTGTMVAMEHRPTKKARTEELNEPNIHHNASQAPLLSDLPQETLIAIFRLLELKDLKSIAQVSKLLHSLAHDKQILVPFIENMAQAIKSIDHGLDEGLAFEEEYITKNGASSPMPSIVSASLFGTSGAIEYLKQYDNTILSEALLVLLTSSYINENFERLSRMIVSLLEAGALPNYKAGNGCNTLADYATALDTPLTIAAKRGMEPIVDILLDKGARITKPLLLESISKEVKFEQDIKGRVKLQMLIMKLDAYMFEKYGINLYREVNDPEIDRDRDDSEDEA